jgi:hypothetical protein
VGGWVTWGGWGGGGNVILMSEALRAADKNIQYSVHIVGAYCIGPLISSGSRGVRIQ